MPIFTYVAKQPNGNTVSGTLEFPTQNLLVEALRKKNLVIVSVKESMRMIRRASSKKTKPDDIVIFSRQLATMIDSGIPMVQALDILTEQIEKKGFKDTIAKIRDDIETGASLSEALSKHPKMFSPLFINMVMAGEKSGMLDEILDRLASYLEKTNALRRKVTSSLIYPCVVTCMAISITLVLILKVIPTFKGIFVSLGGVLPLPTRVLIGISDILRQNFLYCVGVIIVLGFILKRYVATEKGKFKFDQFILKLPIFGSLFRKVAVAKFTRTLATLVKSGVPILDSLVIVGRTSGNKVVEQAVDRARSSIREGENIASPLAASNVFPPMVVRMIAVGEETGELEKMLSKIADFYDEQVDSAVSGLTSMIEPLIIAFLGIVIGGIVIAMFMPIFKLTELIQ